MPFQITVRACDADWYTVESISHVVEIASTDESASLPGPVSLVDGEKVLTVTLNASGSFTFSVDDQTDPSIPQAVSAPAQAFVLQGFEFDRINQKNQYAGVPMAVSLSAVDVNGHIVTGFSGSVCLREITSFGDGRIEPDIVTLINGTWSGNVTNYRADETNINRGNVNIYASLEANPSRNGTSDPFVVHPGPFSRVQIVVPGQSALPGSVTGVIGSPATQGAGQLFHADVFATDAYWNPVPTSDVVRVTSSDPAANTPLTDALANGYRQFSVSLGTVGTQTLSVTDQTNGAIDGMTTESIMVIPNAAHHFVIDPFATPVVAGDSVSVTIRATDFHDNTIPDYSGNAILSANTGPGSISPEAIAFADGIWSGIMVFRGAGGAVSFTCSDFSAPPHTGTSDPFQVLPGPFTGLQVLLPGQTARGGTPTGLSGTPTSQNAGSSFQIRIRAVDDYWNLVPGINDQIRLSSSDPFADLPAETTLNDGERLLGVTLYKAGMQTITADDGDSDSIASHTSSPVELLSGPYARVLILAPGQEIAPGTEEGRTGDATDQSINFAFTVSIYATDSWWNPVSGVTDLIRITSNDPMAQLPPDTNMDDGHLASHVRLATGGFQQITATNLSQPEMPPSTTQVRAISSGFHLEAEVHPTDVQAGEPFTLSVRVTNDAGSTMQEINSFVEIEVQNASTREPGQGTLLTTQFQLLQGERAVQETYTFAEDIVLIARDDAGNAPAVTEPIHVSPGAPAEIEMNSEPSWVGGNKHATINAWVVDEYGNGVPGRPVVFSLARGMGTLTALDDSTGIGGLARADFLSPRQPEINRIRAVSDDLVAVLDVQTALVDPNAPGGTLTNYPNPFHPDEAPTTIAYKLSDNAFVTLKLYTLGGTLVLRKDFPAGSECGRAGLNEFVWDGRDGSGDLVASGGYILAVQAQGAGETLHQMRCKIAVVR
jgi:hypothetical protein